MPFIEKVRGSARRVKNVFRPSGTPIPESPSTPVINSPAPSPIPQASSSVSIGAPVHGLLPSTSQPRTMSPAQASVSSSTIRPPHPDPSSVNQGTTTLPNSTAMPVLPTSGEQSVGGTTWAGLKTFLGLLNQSADAFGPLKSAVGGVLGCIDIYERFGQGREDYEKLANELDSLSEDLAKHFNGTISLTMTSSLENPAKGIKHEVALVRSKEQRRMVERIAEASQDADEVLECYSRIQRLLQRVQFNANVSVWKAVDEQTIEYRLKSLVPSLSALHSSVQPAALRRGGCTPNTRVEVLKTLGNWAYNKDSEKIYWLNGMAGTGKTTITYSLCDLLEGDLKLAASFFCSRQLPECRNPALIFPTISYQIARFSAPFRFALSQAIERDPDVRIRLLQDQFKKLILEPLNAVKDGLPEDIVIVIDALDECENGDIVGQILEILLSHSSDLPIRCFLTSRPEPQIRKQMLGRQGERTRFELHLHDLDRSIVKEDIKIYLADKLTKMNLANTELERLAERSGALFIYAATVVRYLSYEDFSMGADRLRLVLGVPTSAKHDIDIDASPGSSEEKLDSSNPSEKDVDVLYGTILHAGLENLEIGVVEKAQRKRVLYTVVCAREPLTTSAMAGLLGLTSSSSVFRALQPLLSVLNVSEKDGRVTTLHESFPDYIRDKGRSGGFHCDTHKHSSRLAKRCFHLIKTPDPPFNVCGLKSSYLFDEQVEDLQDRVEKSISEELLYACKYWGAHLETAEASNDLVNALSDFVKNRFLLWMEILNLKQCISIGASMLPEIQGWCQRSGCPDNIRQLAQDGWSFITSYSSSPMSRSTPHIYVSALPFWPENRPISRCYMSQMRGLIKPTGSAMRVRKSATLAVCESGRTVRAVAYSSSGTRIVSGSSDRRVRIWDAHTGQRIGEPLLGHTNIVSSVAYSPDGTRVASGSDDHTVRIWDTHAGQSIGGPLQGHTDIVCSVGYSFDGTRIISGSCDRTVRIWDAHTGQIIGEPLRGHTDIVHSVGYSPDGVRIVSGSQDHTVRIWNAHTGQSIGQPLRGHNGIVYSVGYSPDGTRIISGSKDRTVRIWNALTGERIGEPLRGHTDVVYSVGYSPNGTCIVSGSGDNTVRIWDALTGQSIGEPLHGHTSIVYSVGYSPDGARIVSGSNDDTVRIWDAYNSQSIDEPLEGHTNIVYSVGYSPDGTRIVSGSKDRSVRIWDAHTGQSIGEPLQGHDGTVYSVGQSPDGTRVVSGSDDRTVRIWDAHTGQSIGKPLYGHTSIVYSVGYSPDGARIVSGSYDRTVRIWNALTGQSIGRPLQGHTGTVRLVAYSPDSTRIISGSSDHTVRIWNALTGQSIGEPLRGHADVVSSVAYSPNGARIVSGSDDHTVRIWDAHTGRTIGEPLQGHTDIVCSVMYSPDGTRIISGSCDHTVRIWDAHTRQSIGWPLEGHTGTIHSVGYSPDGTRIVSGSDDHTVRIWDAHAGYSIKKSIQGHTEIVNSVAQSPEGYHIISGSSDSTSRIWDARGETQHVKGNSRYLQSPWVINQAGWVVDDLSRLLIWIPPELRGIILHPQSVAVISISGSLSLHFDQTRVGESWSNCYRSASSSRSI